MNRWTVPQLVITEVVNCARSSANDGHAQRRALHRTVYRAQE